MVRQTVPVVRSAEAKFDGGFAESGSSYLTEQEGADVVVQKAANSSVVAPKVAILMCTYHGQRFLVDQLDSFEAQIHSNWELWASDDGSIDKTYSILLSYLHKWTKNRVNLNQGPGDGFAANFLSLICKAQIIADCYAFSDQDDIWTPDKLKRAVEYLTMIPEGVPAIYCSRSQLVDAENRPIGYSTLHTKPASFNNALVQPIAGANTMVMNKAARNLVESFGPSVKIVSHDWWAYQLVTAVGGKIFFDPNPTVRYRQHDSNLSGQNITLFAKYHRIISLLNGRFRKWNDINEHALNEVIPLMSMDASIAFELFKKARRGNVISRIYYLRKSGVYRQTILGNIGLYIATIFKKL